MGITSALAIYFIIWWLVFFCTLPFGVRTQAEAGSVLAGSAPSAPVRPFLRRKVVATTAISVVVFAGVYAILTSGLTLDAIPFVPHIEDIGVGSN